MFAGHLPEDNAIIIDISATFGWTGSAGTYSVLGGAVAFPTSRPDARISRGPSARDDSHHGPVSTIRNSPRGAPEGPRPDLRYEDVHHLDACFGDRQGPERRSRAVIEGSDQVDA
ncbi:hypothetical protein ON010_g18950 [Phytophthora cinnamomi]|nr:hypothetical protein ON010_g18950 [Phytophthora cinnamomi]